MITKKKVYPFLLLSPIFLGVSACSPDNSDLKKYMQAVDHRETRPEEELPDVKYSSTGKLPQMDLNFNPFQWPPLTNGSKKRAIFDSKKQPLQSFPVDDLKFVGTLKRGKTVWALIRQPDNTIVRVGVGESMGTHKGRILVIQDKRIQLEETMHPLNQRSKQVTSLDLDEGE